MQRQRAGNGLERGITYLDSNRPPHEPVLPQPPRYFVGQEAELFVHFGIARQIMAIRMLIADRLGTPSHFQRTVVLAQGQAVNPLCLIAYDGLEPFGTSRGDVADGMIPRFLQSFCRYLADAPQAAQWQRRQ